MKLLTCFTFLLCAYNYCAADKGDEILNLVRSDDLLPGGDLADEIKPIDITYVGLDESRGLLREIPEYFATDSTCETIHHLASGESIVIKSKNFPKTYPKKSQCAFIVKAASGEKASMTCKIFNTKCSSAKVTLKGDGIDTKLCGTKPKGKTYTSNSCELYFAFASNKKAPKGEGFYCTFTSIGIGEPACEPCGMSQLPRKDSRVVNGSETTPGQHPWIAGFVFQYSRFVYCGGSLISHRFILTAAHCAPFIAYFRQVFLGGHNRSDLTIHDLLLVKQVTVLHEYNDTTLEHDIAIVELQDPVKYTSRIQPVCLAPPGITFNHELMVSVGWGLQGPTQHVPPNALQEVVTIAYTTQQCQYYWERVDENNICTGVPYHQQGICAGDSGGPLLKEYNGRFYLAGITSSSNFSCADVFAPDIYTRVTSYLSFIEQYTAVTPKNGHCSPRKCNCGFPDVNARIVGGDELPAHVTPWMVAIVAYGDNSVGCGGTIISEEYVLTAAHCFVDQNGMQYISAGDIQVIFGQHNLTQPAFGRINVKEIISNSNFNQLAEYDSDVSILKLAQPLLFFGERYAPVCLGVAYSNYAKKTLYATGWGQLKEDGNFPDVLHYVELPIIQNKPCTKTYKKKFKITSKMICAGDLKNGQIGTCLSDDGGPILVEKMDYLEQVGVASFSNGCARPKFPGVFARISSFTSWLTNDAKAKYYAGGETYTCYS